MYARRRGGRQGSGYRPNVMGMGGVVAASRISPESSIRGHQMYNSEYRNYNRSGYGRGGHSKPFQPPLPPPCETDIFMEAGKLAAEYLVTKGILPPNALSGKWQNVDLENQIQMEDFMQIPMDSRSSAHSRLGNAAVDVGPGRRRYSDEYNFMGLKNSMRGRRRIGASSNHGSNRNPEFVSGLWFDRGRTSPGMEADNDISAEHQDEQSVQKDSDTGVQSSSAGELTQESDSAADLQSGLEKCNLADDAGAKPGSSSNEKDVPSNDNVETPIKESDGNSTISNEEAEEDKKGRNDNDLEQKHAENMEVTTSLQDGSLASENNIDLMTYCKFANVPTKTLSSLAIRGSKVDLDTIAEDETMNESKLFKDSGVHVMDVPVDGSALDASSHQSHGPNSLSDVLKAPSFEEELGVSHTSRQGHCSIPGSFPKRSVINNQEIDGEFPGYGSSNPIFLGRGEKRPQDDDIDGREETKRPKEWGPLVETQPEGCFLPLSNSMENQHTSVEPSSSHSEHVTLSTDQKSFSLFSKSHIESSEYTEEKQLFPGSFKTCDLNLIEASDMNENHAADPILMFRSITETGRKAAPVDFDLSISNNSSEHNKHGKCGVDDKDIEVIDLEDDSVQEDDTFTNAERRGDSLFNVLDNFPDNVHNATEIPNHQDGYGLMISELLGSDSVTTDLNALHNDMDLHNGQGILGDDDSIYMSFGEIPISFIGSWEQPTQEYGKPF